MPTTDALKTLHTALHDTLSGYEKARQEADGPALTQLFDEMIALREADHAAVHQALVGLGETPDEGGSFMASVHRAVIGVRSAVTGLDRDALPAFIKGEDAILDDYDAALTEQAPHAEIAAMLASRKRELVGKIEEMKRLAA